MLQLPKRQPDFEVPGSNPPARIRFWITEKVGAYILPFYFVDIFDIEISDNTLFAFKNRREGDATIQAAYQQWLTNKTKDNN